MATLRKISIDLTGLSFGKLKVLDFAGYLGRSGPKHAHWRTVCDCGGFRTVRATRLTTGATTSCAPCGRRSGAVKGGIAKRLDPVEKTLREKIDHYRRNALRKGRVFDLDEPTFRSLVQDPCRYCGADPSGGIDRRENGEGYTLVNSVPCCAQCNYAKRDLTEEEFSSWLRRSANFSSESR